jgi:hypothetical protein
MPVSRRISRSNDIRSASQVLARLGLERATLVAKRGDDGHLSDVEAVLGPIIAAGGSSC